MILHWIYFVSSQTTCFFFKKLIMHPNYDYTKVTSQNETPCLLCLFYDRLDMFMLLLEKVEVSKKDNLGNDILIYCLLYEKTTFLHHLIDTRKEDINFNVLNAYINNYGLLERAVPNILYLLENGADINDIDENGNTPLINSILVENYLITEILLQHKPNICHINNEGKNALYYLCETNKLYLIKIILSLGRFGLCGNQILTMLYENNKKYLFKVMLDNFIEIDILHRDDCLLCSSIYMGSCDRNMIYMWKMYYYKNYFSSIIKYRYRVSIYSRIEKVISKLSLSNDIIQNILQFLGKKKKEEYLRKLVMARYHFLYHFKISLE